MIEQRVVAALFCIAPMVVFGARAQCAPAYVVNEIEVTDQVGFKSYAEQQGDLIHSFGGRFLVRGGKTETIAGARVEPRITIYVFDSMDKVKEWESVPAQKQLAALRDRSSHFRSYVVEGLPDE